MALLRAAQLYMCHLAYRIISRASFYNTYPAELLVIVFVLLDWGLDCVARGGILSIA